MKLRIPYLRSSKPFFMKNLFILFTAFVLYSCSSVKGVSSAKSAVKNYPPDTEKIHWLAIDEAQEMMKVKPKKMLVDVYTSWCGPCKLLDRTTFSDPQVIDYVGQNYYPVKFNAESADVVKFAGQEYGNPNFNPNNNPRKRNSPHELTRKFAIRGYPTILVIDEKLEIQDSHIGFKPADELLKLLK